jgi:small subunit ribosomal protein S8
MVTDPVSDMLSRINNAITARHERVEIPLSKIKLKIAEILKQEGYIGDFSIQSEGQPSLSLALKYDRLKAPAIIGLRRLSRPGRRLYVGHKNIPGVLNGMGISIISTSRGLLTDKEARKQNIGGEILCEVW